MKSLTNYILEKLKINKDVRSHFVLKPGDEFSILSLYFNNEWDKKVELQICPPFKVKSVDDKKIIYNVPFHDRDVELEYYVNSKGYYQHDDKDSRSQSNKERNYNNEILMYPQDYKELLELLLKEKIFNPKYSENAINKITDMLNKHYFNKIDMEELRSKQLIVYNNTLKSVVMPIERPKELKDIINTHYEKY